MIMIALAISASELGGADGGVLDLAGETVMVLFITSTSMVYS